MRKLKKRKEYMRLPATTTAIRAWRRISASVASRIIDVKTGTDRTGSSITKRAANDARIVVTASPIGQPYY